VFFTDGFKPSPKLIWQSHFHYVAAITAVFPETRPTELLETRKTLKKKFGLGGHLVHLPCFQLFSYLGTTADWANRKSKTLYYRNKYTNRNRN